ncbi:MAG: hypothetical protein KC777_21580 [Cyanobacteria bacterium HKST-UBA02]|nr:hypothetical protein [Cyanobacteria bacterium HKST-UBA02]
MTRLDGALPQDHIQAQQALDGTGYNAGREENTWLAACVSDCWSPPSIAGRGADSGKRLPDLPEEKLSELKEKLNLPESDTAAGVRGDINRYGTNPGDTAVELMKKNRVLGMGEFHEGDSQFRATGIKTIERLKAAGATHLAVEMPSDLKPLYEQFEKTGEIPDGMLTGYWNTRDFRELVTEARKAGLKVVPVDLPRPWDGKWSQRDPHMARLVGDILDSDPNNKVVLWLGAMHVANVEGKAHDQYTTAGTVLKDRYPGQVATMEHVRTSERLLGLTTDLEKPTSVRTRGTAVGRLKESAYIQEDGQLPHDGWDYSVIYPVKNGKR